MGTKRTKKEEAAAAPIAKPAPKRKMAMRPPTPAAKAPAANAAAKSAASPKIVKKPAVSTAKPVVEIPSEAIALRAYFISEARQAAGEPGDSTTDWLEAERQLRAEL
jgi:hypothetical protein